MQGRYEYRENRYYHGLEAVNSNAERAGCENATGSIWTKE